MYLSHQSDEVSQMLFCLIADLCALENSKAEAVGSMSCNANSAMSSKGQSS